MTPAAISAKRSASVPLLTRDAMLRLAEFGELLLKAFHHRAADEAGGAQRGAEYGDELFLELDVRSNQIQKWNF